jgi:hypothetical protein
LAARSQAGLLQQHRQVALKLAVVGQPRLGFVVVVDADFDLVKGRIK